MIAIFVYGTLQHEPLLERLLGRVPRSMPARLPGHRAAPLTGRVYPGLVVDPDASAPGRLIEVTPAEADALDRFEGPEYERRPMTALPQSGDDVSCEAWLLTGASLRLAQPGAWTLERFLAEDVDAFLGDSVVGEAHPGAGA